MLASSVPATTHYPEAAPSEAASFLAAPRSRKTRLNPIWNGVGMCTVAGACAGTLSKIYPAQVAIYGVITYTTTTKPRKTLTITLPLSPTATVFGERAHVCASVFASSDVDR